MNYFSPKTTSELFELLGSVKNYTILSGGTDLMPRFESGTPLPENLIVLKKISELAGIREIDEEIEIGASVTIAELQNNPQIHR